MQNLCIRNDTAFFEDHLRSITCWLANSYSISVRVVFPCTIAEVQEISTLVQPESFSICDAISQCLTIGRLCCILTELEETLRTTTSTPIDTMIHVVVSPHDTWSTTTTVWFSSCTLTFATITQTTITDWESVLTVFSEVRLESNHFISAATRLTNFECNNSIFSCNSSILILKTLNHKFVLAFFEARNWSCDSLAISRERHLSCEVSLLRTLNQDSFSLALIHSRSESQSDFLHIFWLQVE